MGMKMNEFQVNFKVKKFAKEIWGLEFDLPIEISGRLTAKLGYMQVVFNRRTFSATATKLVFAKRLINGDYSEGTIDSVILHETCHWALLTQGKPYNDGHPVFENELKRIGGSSTRTINNAGELHEAVCSCCGKVVVSSYNYNTVKKYVNDPRYTSKCCKAKINYKGSSYIEDKFVKQEAKDKSIEEIVRKFAFAGSVSTVENIKQAIPVEHKTPINIITPGPKGVSNAQMIPAIKEALDQNDKTRLELLKQQYSKIYDSSLKYLSGKYKEKLNKIGA